jgi:hypothetical protein
VVFDPLAQSGAGGLAGGGEEMSEEDLIPKRYMPGDPISPDQVVVMVMQTMQYCRESVEKALVGRYVRVKSDHNGQPYGRSRKSWREQVCRIKSVHIDLYANTPVFLALEGHEYECFIPANEVEFT